MTTQQRREMVKKKIKQCEKPISASALAQLFHVSRQIIVSDVAILRASQEPILATPRGYMYDNKDTQESFLIACMHDQQDTKDELETIVDLGGVIQDVSIAHPVYGELKGNLHISSRLDIQEFLTLCKDKQAKNLSDLSDGVHFHNIICPTIREYNMIVEALKKKGYLFQQEY